VTLALTKEARTTAGELGMRGLTKPVRRHGPQAQFLRHERSESGLIPNKSKTLQPNGIRFAKLCRGPTVNNQKEVS